MRGHERERLQCMGGTTSPLSRQANRSSLQPLVASLGLFFCPTRSTNIISREQSAWILFLRCFSCRRVGPWCIGTALLFENPVVHGCLFVACLVLFAWRLCIAALLCLVCLIVGGQFRTITCRQIRLAHSSVCQGSHTLAHPSDLRLDKGCKIPVWGVSGAVWRP